MSLSVYTKGDYEEFCGFGRRKNKANSKPIQSMSLQLRSGQALSAVEWANLS